MSRLASLLAVAFLLASGCAKGPAVGVATETVYVTKTGKKYHRDGCEYLRKSEIEKTLQEAVDEGYTPCSKCNPPTL
jgi:hypothetical protein